MTQLFVNNFSATVAQTFGSSDTYLYVSSAAGLPALTGGNFLLLTVFRKVGIDESGHEVVKVTAIVADMLTVERAVEGAAASLFNVGDRVGARVTAASLAAKADALDAYVHPANHTASVITQDTNNRFVTDAEKTTWNDKAEAGPNSDITSLTGLTTALSVAQGGTGVTAPSTSGNVLTSNGTTWSSAAPASTVPGYVAWASSQHFNTAWGGINSLNS